MRTQRYNNKNCTKRKSSDSDEPISPPQKKKKSRVLLPAVIEKGSEEEYARNIKVCRAEVLRGKNANEDMIKKLLEVKFETFELWTWFKVMDIFGLNIHKKDILDNVI